MGRPKPYDILVVGAGIAGLAIAEIFSRSGLRIALLEKNPKVCQESSGTHQEWFHFGSLYSIFPNNQFMRTLVGGIDDMLDYYRSFPGMNIIVNRKGKLEFEAGLDQWIRNEPIEYIVSARNDSDFSLGVFDGPVNYARKLFFLLTWEMAIKQFIARHQRFHQFDWRTGPASEWVPRAGWLDYSREVISSVTDLDACITKNTHFKIPGFDKPMNATNIIEDLLRSFLSHGGELHLDSPVNSAIPSDKGPVKITLENSEFYAKKVIFASGKYLNGLMGNRLSTKVIASPLLVAYPQVCRQNFVRLTPFLEKTLNHISHYANGRPYSVIGGGYFADADDPAAIEKSKAALLETAERVFPKMAEAELKETYVGYKTEFVASGKERNYQYQIKKVDDDIYVAIPGKFSLAFSLARHAHIEVLGAEPCRQSSFDVTMDVSEFTTPIKHRHIVIEHLRGETCDSHPVLVQKIDKAAAGSLAV